MLIFDFINYHRVSRLTTPSTALFWPLRGYLLFDLSMEIFDSLLFSTTVKIE